MTYLVLFKDRENEDVAVERECVIVVKPIEMYKVNDRCVIVCWRGEQVEVKGTVAEVVEKLNEVSAEFAATTEFVEGPC